MKITGEVASALTTILTFLVGYFVPEPRLSECCIEASVSRRRSAGGGSRNRRLGAAIWRQALHASISR